MTSTAFMPSESSLLSSMESMYVGSHVLSDAMMPLARNSFPLSRKALAAGKAANIPSLLDLKATAAALDGLAVGSGPYAQRVPAENKLLRSWQFAVTGKAAAAAVLTEVNATQIKHGGPLGIQEEASKYIAEHRLDDTFYVVDLGNTLRMFKAIPQIPA